MSAATNPTLEVGCSAATTSDSTTPVPPVMAIHLAVFTSALLVRPQRPSVRRAEISSHSFSHWAQRMSSEGRCS